MPSVNIPATLPIVNRDFFKPEIIGRAPDADLIRRMNLAKLRELESAPDLREREFQERTREFNVGAGQKQAELGETERYHTGELDINQQHLGYLRDELASRLASAREEHEAQILDTLVRTAPSLGLGQHTAGVLADVLDRSGHPQLKASLGAALQQQQDQQYQQQLTSVQGAPPDKREKLIQGFDKATQDRIRGSLATAATIGGETPTAPATPPAGSGMSMYGVRPSFGVEAQPNTMFGDIFPNLKSKIGGFFNTKPQEASRKKKGEEFAITPP